MKKVKKSRKSKSKKTSKSHNLAKSGKKLLKSENLPNFNAKKTFNHLWVFFIEASILGHFDLKYYIWIETNALVYVIGRVLSQLTFKICFDEIVFKIDLS